MNQDSSVGIVTGYRLDDWDSIPSRGKRFFSFLQHEDWIWGTPSFLSNGYWGSISGGKVAGAWSWPLTSIKWRGQEWWSYTSAHPYTFMALSHVYAMAQLVFAVDINPPPPIYPFHYLLFHVMPLFRLTTWPPSSSCSRIYWELRIGMWSWDCVYCGSAVSWGRSKLCSGCTFKILFRLSFQPFRTGAAL
jgi:hypothetical protein